MMLEQNALRSAWALRSLVISMGVAGLLAGCRQPEASAGPGPVSDTKALSGEKACAEIAAAADRVFFEYDSAQLRPDARATLDALATRIQQRPQCHFVIEGHCDERGTREYNLALGERRASVVMSYLAALGVDSARMQTTSYGKERPAMTGTGEEIWAKNRRAVLVFR